MMTQTSGQASWSVRINVKESRLENDEASKSHGRMSGKGKNKQVTGQ